MSTTLKPTDLTRLAWTTALRMQGDRQCQGELWIRDGGGGTMACALGILAEVTGYSHRGIWPNFEMLRQHAGLTKNQVDWVIAMNDGMGACGTKLINKPQSFAAIANEIDSWFKP